MQALQSYSLVHLIGLVPPSSGGNKTTLENDQNLVLITFQLCCPVLIIIQPGLVGYTPGGGQPTKPVDAYTDRRYTEKHYQRLHW